MNNEEDLVTELHDQIQTSNKKYTKRNESQQTKPVGFSLPTRTSRDSQFANSMQESQQESHSCSPEMINSQLFIFDPQEDRDQIVPTSEKDHEWNRCDCNVTTSIKITFDE